jgi:hypothetical protein
MVTFRVELAGTVAEINALYSDTRTLCNDYITDHPAAFSVAVTEADIEKERGLAIAHNPSAQNLESMALYRKLCTKLAGRDTILVHGSCISVGGQAYLFCAPSGTGKSTHTRLWRQLLGERAVMINDDKPLIRVSSDSVKIFGTPWNGKHHLGCNISAPLRSICFLYRGSINTIEKAAQEKILPLLLKYTFRPESPADMLKVLNTASRVAKLCDFWSLNCNMDLDAADVSYTAMSMI